MAAPSYPPPPRRSDGPYREFLEDGTEITRVTDRDLLIRVVNHSLRTDVAIGALMAEVAETRDDVRDIKRKLFGRQGSIPDLVDAAQRLAEVADEITDHGQQKPADVHDSDRVRTIAREEDERARDSAELERFRRRVSYRWDVTKQILGAAGGGVVLELCRLLVTGHW